jgi:hypothetical protein
MAIGSVLVVGAVTIMVVATDGLAIPVIAGAAVAY